MELNVTSNMEEAYLYAVEKHLGQKRKFSDVPYIRHPELVTCVLASYTDDECILKAALLHDTVEDTDATLEDIVELFGEKVSNLVDELTNDQKQIDVLGKKVYMAGVFNILSDDALLIKLVDRLHNVIGLLGNSDIPSKFIKWYHDETAYILNSMDRELTEQHEELINTLRLVLIFVDLQEV